MSGQLASPPLAARDTYKVAEAEGILDRLFYRKVGFQCARFFLQIRVTPVGVTLLGGLVGLFAGHLYYYRDLRLNIIGMVLHVFANVLDNADGQLARMTGKASREGRIIDSVVDHIVFINIYLHLFLRCMAEGFSPAIFWLALAAGLSHSLQAAAADYFRNGFVYFVNGPSKAKFDSSDDLSAEYRRLNWRDEPWKKFLLALSLSFTRLQERMMPAMNRLREVVHRHFHDEIPNWLEGRYRAGSRPLFKWFGLLMTNTRMLILFFLLLIDQPVWFFWIQLTVFNVLLVWLLNQQSKMLNSLLAQATTSR